MSSIVGFDSFRPGTVDMSLEQEFYYNQANLIEMVRALNRRVDTLDIERVMTFLENTSEIGVHMSNTNVHITEVFKAKLVTLLGQSSGTGTVTYETRALMCGDISQPDATIATVRAEPGNSYKFRSVEDKWIMSNGNFYEEADLPDLNTENIIIRPGTQWRNMTLGVWEEHDGQPEAGGS